MRSRTAAGVALLTAWVSCSSAMAAQEVAANAEASTVRHVIDRARVARGLCSLLGCEHPKVVLELARQSDLLVHALDPNAACVNATCRLLESQSLYGRRALTERWLSRQLPYADNMMDLIASVDLTDAALDGLAATEVLRSLRPGGKAILGRSRVLHGADGLLTLAKLKPWIESLNTRETATAEDDTGVWVILTKPRLAGAEDWSHWEHGPDNNPVSNDSVIQAPYMTQWLGLPYYITMPAITTASDGRLFIAMGHIAHHQREEVWLNTLLASNGYNGETLWMRKLPDGYLAHRSAFVAAPDAFYMIDHDGTGVLLLDPETGEQKARIRTPSVRGFWKWIALADGLLYAMVGKDSDRPETTIVRSQYPHWSWGELSRGYYEPQVPWGFGETILAYDLKAGKLAWTHRPDAPMDSRAMAIGGGRLFFYAPRARIGCLDARSGKLLWGNTDPKVYDLIDEPGRGLSSTPGFRTTCYALYTPKALFYEAQTQMNVVAVSLEDGRLLWHRKKTTSNPNMMYLQDRLLVGIGPEGNTLALDPMTGRTLEDLGFRKRSCARLTATPDSLFCRGYPEGVTRYDRDARKILFNGAFRPSCNDGVIAANGLLYTGPWTCDCNLTLMGRIAMCSAGAFKFDRKAVEAERLEIGSGDLQRVVPLGVSEKDWPTYRSSNARGAATPASASRSALRVWHYRPNAAVQSTVPTTAGGLIFVAGNDGAVRALDAASGSLRWSFLTAGPILQPPTIWNDRAYVGSGDGYIYALEAATGRMLWRFRAAPTERRVMVYGSLCSTWPVNTGVLVSDGVAYAAAGIIDYDGTYVYALDALTGRIRWQNIMSGHLDQQLRKGVSAQGVLTLAGGRLWMPGGNVISPAAYDMNTGEYIGDGPGDGSPRANRGEEIGVVQQRALIRGGRLQYSATENIVDPGEFEVLPIKPGRGYGPAFDLATSKIPPAWSDERIVLVDGRHKAPVCYDAKRILELADKGDAATRPEMLWRADWLAQSDTVALAMAQDVVLSVCESFRPRQLASRWRLCCTRLSDGRRAWECDLAGAALPGGLIIDRDGRIIVSLQNGEIMCFGDEKAIRDHVARLIEQANSSQKGRQQAQSVLLKALDAEENAEARRSLADQLKKIGLDVTRQARKNGWVCNWHLIGPVPWDTRTHPLDEAFVGEPEVNLQRECSVAGRTLRWEPFAVNDLAGRVNLVGVYGELENVATYAFAEIRLTRERDIVLRLGSNDGFKCWFNGKVIGQLDGGRAYRPDSDVITLHGRSGVNRLLLKVSQMGGAWMFSGRLTETDGAAIDLNE